MPGDTSEFSCIHSIKNRTHYLIQPAEHRETELEKQIKQHEVGFLLEKTIPL